MISIVIPIFNEEEIISELFSRTVNALNDITEDFEIICVDDGSQDTTLVRLLEFHKKDSRFKVISLSRNFGHQRAILAGLTYTKGDFIGIMDGDLQDPPELFRELYNKLDNGYEVAYAVRKNRKENFFKRISYKTFYRLLSAVSETNIPIDSGDFSMFKRIVLDHMLKMQEQSLFLRGIRSWVGFNQIAIPYDRDERIAGKPKFNLKRMLHLAYSGFFSFSNFPIKFLGRLGFLIILFSIIYAIVVIVKRLLYPEFVPEGFTTLILSILFLSGVQLVSLRILGEYIVRTYEESKQRPLFIVKDEHID